MTLASGAPTTPRDSRLLYGLELDAVTMDQVLTRARLSVASRQRYLIGVVNAAKIVKMRHDALLRDSLIEADVLVADGQSVVWASRILGHPLPERIAGIDLFEHLLESADEEGRSIYLLGARQDVLDELVSRIEKTYPNLTVAGSRNGYFSDDEAAEVAADIAASKADMLFLGITSPKKEIFLARFGDELGVPLLHGVGGSFDVMAGITKRAPIAWQHAGMEWAYRLLQEPRRMWRRYLPTNTAFIALTARERLRPAAPFTLAQPTQRSHHG